MRHGEPYGRPWYNHTPVVYSVPRGAGPVPGGLGRVLRSDALNVLDARAV
jgi:hypothetical protein